MEKREAHRERKKWITKTEKIPWERTTNFPKEGI
jgi:hypothetical protein